MKKSLVAVLLICFTFGAVCSAEEVEKIDWRESGRSVLKATEQFIKDAGEAVKESIENATDVKCYGTWVYESENITTTFTCLENGTMEISKKFNHETDYWKGTYSSALRTFSFYITEAGRKSLFSKNAKTAISKIWTITYFVVEEGESIKIFSNDIPTDIDGTDFSKGVIFHKK